MTLRGLLLISGLFVHSLAFGESLQPPAELLGSDYLWLARQRFLENVIDPSQKLKDVRPLEKQKMKEVMDDRQQTAENKYLAASAYASFSYILGATDEVRGVCDKFPPKTDDFPFQANCALVQKEEINSKIARLVQIAEKAQLTYPNRMLASNIYNNTASYLNNRGRLHQAIHMYKKSFETIPPRASEELIQAKISLAFAYSSSLLSQGMRQQAMQFFDEGREWYRLQALHGDDSDYKWVSYNKGLGYLLLFNDYNKAIEELKLVEGLSRLEVDALVFTAYSQAQLGQAVAAKATLARINISQTLSPHRKAFLQCYMDLTRLLLKESNSIESCLSLEDPQTDVLLDLLKTLSTLNLPSGDENRMWRKFYKFFSTHLLPDIQMSMESATAQAELEIEKSNGRLKDLKLQNLSLYQYLSAAMVVAVLVFGFALLTALRQRRASRLHAQNMVEERERLQNILDSIEEGILIISDNLKVKIEESKHVRSITGTKDRQDLSFPQLLDLFHWGEDRKSLIIACLEACLKEDPLAWNLNSSHLPASTQMGAREIAFFWQPVFHQNILRSVILVLRDVSANRALERETERARVKADRIMIYAREILSGHPKAAARFLHELPELLLAIHRAQTSGDGSQLLRLLHTIKGSARTLGLHQLQEQSHLLETLTRENSAKLPQELQELQEIADTYGSALPHILGSDLVHMAASLYDLIGAMKMDLQHHLEEAGIGLDRLTVSDTTPLDPMEIQSMHDILLHALTNAADHGFILPAQRGWEAHPAAFDVSVHRQGTHKVLQIRDNGKGIDYQTVRAVAKSQGWQPNADQSWADVLFLEGFSTAGQISKRSGRGVGMAVIVQAAQKIKGEVHLLDNDQGTGTMLRVSWPAKGGS